MTFKVEWRGNEHTNKSDRRGYKPIAIINHVVAGSGQSCDHWFRSSGNKVSSAHYCVWEDGRITQYVKLEDNAWAQGLSTQALKDARDNQRVKNLTHDIVREMNVNPNFYCIGIEHAGHTGKLTEKQFQATVWLHKHIQKEVKRIYGHTIPFNRDRILGHFELDPIRKPLCPGVDFPWKELMDELNKKEQKGDDDKLNLTNYQWGELEKNIKTLLAEKIITSESWVTKAQNKTLTVSEICWLNNMVLMRLRK